MSKSTCLPFEKPRDYPDDPLTQVLRHGARKLLAQAVEAEVASFLVEHQEVRDADGHQMIVRNGHLPERSIETGIGEVVVKAPRVRDRRDLPAQDRIRFASSILPRYLRRTKSLEELIPWLYLRGISTGDFTEALAALVGRDAPGLSASTISRLKESWQQELTAWEKRDLSSKRYVYLWVDGIYFGIRLEEANHCMLVVIGATADGHKELVAIEDGYRESAQSWKELLLDLKHRGLTDPPALAIGDGALGFWKALPEVYGQTRRQRCWVHKTANVLNYLPRSVQKKAKDGLHEIWMAETKEAAEKAFDHFVETYGAKYPKAVECLVKDRDVLLTFYDFPAEHWEHIRSTNPIESTFATVRLRTDKTKGCLSRVTALTMTFKLVCSAEKRWRRLNSPKLVEKVIRGVRFADGVEQEAKAA